MVPSAKIIIFLMDIRSIVGFSNNGDVCYILAMFGRGTVDKTSSKKTLFCLIPLFDCKHQSQLHKRGVYPKSISRILAYGMVVPMVNALLFSTTVPGPHSYKPTKTFITNFLFVNAWKLLKRMLTYKYPFYLDFTCRHYLTLSSTPKC